MGGNGKWITTGERVNGINENDANMLILEEKIIVQQIDLNKKYQLLLRNNFKLDRP